MSRRSRRTGLEERSMVITVRDAEGHEGRYRLDVDLAPGNVMVGAARNVKRLGGDLHELDDTELDFALDEALGSVPHHRPPALECLDANVMDAAWRQRGRRY